MTDPLREAAKAVVDFVDGEESLPFRQLGERISALRAALANPAPALDAEELWSRLREQRTPEQRAQVVASWLAGPAPAPHRPVRYRDYGEPDEAGL